VSFAQSLSGSQPQTPLDLSEFPSLSNNPGMSGGNQASMWSSTANPGSRNISAPVQRNQGTPLSSQANQEDLFSPGGASRVGSQQGSFRFGNQGGPPPQQSQPSTGEDFPPLNRGANGDMSAERLGTLGFGPQAGSSLGGLQTARNNGLLNALSANDGASQARSPPGFGVPGSSRPQDDDGANKTLSSAEQQNPDGSSGESREDRELQPPEGIDLLAGMPEADKWGIKGLKTLMNNHSDYQAMVIGLDHGTLGLDVNSPDPISSQVYSIFDETPPRPTVNGQRMSLPDCYTVTNVQPIETKITGFNEETLFWIFYSCPGDVKQQMAAEQLNNRNWRWHKKAQLWLTKDEQMTPQILGPNQERGYYIVWDAARWQKDRRELVLSYSDLDTSLSQGPGP